jgi:hypothetical protein
MRYPPAALLFLLPVAVLAGCARDDRLAVSGTVTLDGKPLKEAIINFAPVDGAAAHSSGAAILDGEFTIPAEQGIKPGKYRVTIQGVEDTGRTVRDPTMGDIAYKIPITYKEEGKLEETVVAGSENRFDFKLTHAGR